jgi:methyl-accepting chemotaxis protein
MTQDSALIHFDLDNSGTTAAGGRPVRHAVSPRRAGMKRLAASWANTGLQFKLQVLIQGFLFVVLLVTQHWFASQLEERALAAAHDRAVAIADGVINSLNTLMVTKVGQQDVISDAKARALFIEKMGFSDDLKELRVVRAKAVSDEFGPGLPQEAPVDAMDQQVLADAHGQSTLDRERGSLRAVLPFLARKEFRASRCLECHGVPEGSVLGAVSITIDVSADLGNIARLDRLIWLGQAVLQVLLFFAIGFIVRRQLRELGAEPRDAALLARAVAAGDLTQEVRLKRGDTRSLMAHLASMQEDLTKIVARVRQDSEGVAAASSEIAQGNQDLSERTERQASALEQTAASMEELTSTVKQNAESAREANQLAAAASAVATKCGNVVSQVVGKMRDIDDSSHRISAIIALIDGIAFQTNILALNAAVEAARAGEQGRGFAVVASEVRSLAGRSAEAAKEIKQLIGTTATRVGEGKALVDQAGAIMGEVVDSIARLAGIMAAVSQANDEQTRGLSQVEEAVVQMDQTTQQNAAMVEQLTSAASSLKSLSAQLVDTVSIFRIPGRGGALTAAAAVAGRVLAAAGGSTPHAQRRTSDDDLPVATRTSASGSVRA